ncbi:MAG: hypothetical protein WEA09_03290 [Gemmatimonadota bacterium]
MSKPRRSRKSSNFSLPEDGVDLRRLAIRMGLSAGGAAAGGVAERMLRRQKSSLGSLLKAAAAGVTAALLVAAARPVLARAGVLSREPEDEDNEDRAELPDLLLGGAGRGLVYGALLHPLLPGPPLLRGMAYGTVEYVLGPVGGASGLLQPLTPWRKVPGMSHLFHPGDPSRTPFVDHILYGVALGVLYGRGARKGTRGD